MSLFFKKGDLTLTANYRLISSMNTDCKMYTNLVNAHLMPWAQSQIHSDQKGFIAGWYIAEHTCLATEVVHLSNSTGQNGWIVSLDMAKAYDRVDLPWLLCILEAMAVGPDLVLMVWDVVLGVFMCVRINGGYSWFFELCQGVCQGDPLSPLLFDFNIELLSLWLQQAVVGISVLGLPPVQLEMYADDTNVFLDAELDSVSGIQAVLLDTSFTIGSKFNLEKTDVLPVGFLVFQ